MEERRCSWRLWNEERENRPKNGNATCLGRKTPAQGRGRTPGKKTGDKPMSYMKGNLLPGRS